MAVLTLLLGLTGCGAAREDTPVLTRVILDRGHGSMWGDQFYVDVCAEEILQTNYFSPDDPGGELLSKSGLPIDSQSWAEIVSAVEALAPLTPVRESLWKKLFGGGRASDGTGYRHLTLYWADGEAIGYQWPDNEDAAALEKLLEQLILQ